MSVEYNILTILAIHFVADFMLQTRKMGRGKGKSLKLLSLHVLVYTAATVLGWEFFLEFANRPVFEILLFFAITFVTHWITDFITSKMSGYCYLKMVKEKELEDELCENAQPGDVIHYHGDGDRTKERTWEYGFWTAIGFDQLIHAFTLIMTYKYFF